MGCDIWIIVHLLQLLLASSGEDTLHLSHPPGPGGLSGPVYPALGQTGGLLYSVSASPLLCDRLSPCSSNIALLPNGINLPLFDANAFRKVLSRGDRAGEK